MEKTNKAIRQRIGRMKTNLGFSEKRDELASVAGIDQRNQKVVSSIHTFRKNISSCIKTGLREEQAEKRKKKCDEFALCSDLVADAKELRMNGSTCLHKVLENISHALNSVMDERVNTEMKTEKRVLDGLSRYLEMDKALAKSKERLTHTTVDVEIARKALNNKQHDESRQTELQEEFDTNCAKLESLKDSTITDIFTLASKEQDISLVFALYIEELIEYHAYALRVLENVLPEIKRDIANARPRPMFGIDLEEHLRHSNRPISVVIEKCCTILRANGMRERGVFRVNGNNTKIRRIKAAFDAGQMVDENVDSFATDPHSVCSVLKSYLRELPDPLLTNRLHVDWVAATKVEGEERLLQVENCLAQLPPAYHNNLAYLVNFLCELLQYEKITMMNAGNLAIVFGPNLVGNGNETDNVTGSKIVETLLLNENRFFGRSPYYSKHESPQPSLSAHSTPKEIHSIARVNSTPYGGKQGRLIQHQRNFFEVPAAQGTGSLSIDTHGSFRNSTKSLSHSPIETTIGSSSSSSNTPQGPQSFTNASFSHNSQSNSIRRPRVTAPLPPSNPGQGSNDDTMSRSAYSSSGRDGPGGISQQQANLNEVMEHLNSLRGDGESMNNVYKESALRETSRDSSFDSIDDLDDDSLTRSLDRPLRPPPPSLRPGAHNTQKARPISYNIAVGVNPPEEVLIDVGDNGYGSVRNRSSTIPSDPLFVRNQQQGQPEMQCAQSTIISTSTSQMTNGPIHRSIVSIEGPTAPTRTRPPLPNKPGKLPENDSGTLVTSSTIPLKPKEYTKL